MDKKYEQSKSNTAQICRIASLKGFDGVIIGRDLGDILKAGHVYQVVDIMGDLLITDLGEHAIPEWLGTTGRVGHYLQSGVTMLTKEEYENQKANG